jgi:DNA excision repair protein ERCC-3
MTIEFYKEYLGTISKRKKEQIYIMNPNKLKACEFLINYHENRGDKIMVFSDDIFAIEYYAKSLKKPFLHGEFSQEERLFWLSLFQKSDEVSFFFFLFFL